MLRLLIAQNLQDSACLWEYRVRGDTGEVAGQECSEDIICFTNVLCGACAKAHRDPADDHRQKCQLLSFGKMMKEIANE